MIGNEFGMVGRTARIDRTELYAADEIFLHRHRSSGVAVTSVDHRSVGTGNPGPFCMKLQSTYLAACRGENEKYQDWITPVYK